MDYRHGVERRQSYSWSKCVIIDDLCCSGGTSLRAANILKENGAVEVVLVVFHCEETIFNGEILNDDSPISQIYTSKSIMDKEHPKIHYMDVNVWDYVYGIKKLAIY